MTIQNLIQRADLNQRITRALEIKGQKSPVLTLDNSVVAVVIADDLTKQGQWTTPTDRKTASTAIVAPVAAQFGLLVVSNPAGSGIVAVVERVTAVSAAGMQVQFGLVNPAAIPVTFAPVIFRDRRNLGIPTCRAFFGTDAAGQIISNYLTFQVPTAAAAPWYETEGIVIQPGETFGIQALTVNVQFAPTLWLQEYPIA